MDYQQWEESAPEAVRGDPLWGLRVYRAALYVGDVACEDGRQLQGHPLTGQVAGQLVRAAGSIAANIAEGYSRASKRDRAKFYEYALGSARESRVWYYQVRDELGPSTTLSRIGMLTSIARILVTLIARTRPD